MTTVADVLEELPYTPKPKQQQQQQQQQHQHQTAATAPEHNEDDGHSTEDDEEEDARLYQDPLGDPDNGLMVAQRASRIARRRQQRLNPAAAGPRSPWSLQPEHQASYAALHSLARALLGLWRSLARVWCWRLLVALPPRMGLTIRWLPARPVTKLF